jgi:hypothetical protein
VDDYYLLFQIDEENDHEDAGVYNGNGNKCAQAVVMGHEVPRDQSEEKRCCQLNNEYTDGYPGPAVPAAAAQEYIAEDGYQVYACYFSIAVRTV